LSRTVNGMRYVLRLVDAGTLESIPDTTMTIN
jgi:hypothetical protein